MKLKCLSDFIKLMFNNKYVNVLNILIILITTFGLIFATNELIQMSLLQKGGRKAQAPTYSLKMQRRILLRETTSIEKQLFCHLLRPSQIRRSQTHKAYKYRIKMIRTFTSKSTYCGLSTPVPCACVDQTYSIEHNQNTNTPDNLRILDRAYSDAYPRFIGQLESTPTHFVCIRLSLAYIRQPRCDTDRTSSNIMYLVLLVRYRF